MCSLFFAQREQTRGDGREGMIAFTLGWQVMVSGHDVGGIIPKLYLHLQCPIYHCQFMATHPHIWLPQSLSLLCNSELIIHLTWQMAQVLHKHH